MSFPKYESYRNSGVEWLGEVPEHWNVEPLKRSCQIFPSNVDKKSYEEQTPVLLCNYTDVYYNEEIVSGMQLMSATATKEQIEKFTLQAGDVVFTKDSESADDIAIAAYIPQDLPGVICSYHLSVVRSSAETDGAFVKRFFDSQSAKAYFAVSANGLTRVGLSQYATDNIPTPIPPLSEQTQIARFLDHETARIDALIAEQERLIALLKEKRQAVISHAVTKGLDSTVPMKDSGVEWLGEVPAHWTTCQSKYLFDSVTSGSRGWAEFYSDDGYLFFRITNLTRDTIDPKLLSKRFVNPPLGSEGERSKIEIGDILISITADLGSVCVANPAIVDGYVSQHVALVKPRKRAVVSRWLGYSILSVSCKEQLLGAGYGGTKIQLSLEDIKSFLVAVPPYEEQIEISTFLDSESRRFESLREEAIEGVILLKERRSALISAAVTGKIDVRNWQSPTSTVFTPTLEAVYP